MSELKKQNDPCPHCGAVVGEFHAETCELILDSARFNGRLRRKHLGFGVDNGEQYIEFGPCVISANPASAQP